MSCIQVETISNGTKEWVTLPTPKLSGITVTDEPVWTSETGRSNVTGEMLGEIVTWKKTVAVTFPPLSYSESHAIRNAIKNAGSFFRIKYIDDNNSGTLENPITVYTSNIPRTIYSIEESLRYHTDVTVTFIEK